MEFVGKLLGTIIGVFVGMQIALWIMGEESMTITRLFG